MEFETWEIAEAYLNNYALQEGFCFRKRRRNADLTDSTITRRQTFECLYARSHDANLDITLHDFLTPQILQK